MTETAISPLRRRMIEDMTGKRGKSWGGYAGAQRALTRSGRGGTAGASGIPSRAPR